MRSIGDILTDAQDGKIPTHEECFYTMLALRGKNHFLMQDLRSIKEKHDVVKGAGENVTSKQKFALSLNLSLRLENLHETNYKFLNTDPLIFLGKNHDPLQPEAQNFRDSAKKILDAALKRAGG